MAKMGKTVEEAIANVEQQVNEDMAPVLGIGDEWDLNVCLQMNEDHTSRPISGTFYST